MNASITNASASPRAAKVWARLAQLLSRTWLRVLLLFLLSFAVRAPALSGEFIWDDEFLARDSPFIKGPLFFFEVFRQHLFPDSFSAHYRPVQNLSFIFDYYFWHNNPFGFHLTNVLLHAGSAVVLYFLLFRLLQSVRKTAASGEKTSLLSGLAFFGALLWAVHPVHSAAVDYISGRADSLAFLFAAGAWVLFFRARDTRPRTTRAILFAGVAFLGLLALCSRETACIWVVLILLHTLFFDRKISRRGKVLVAASCLVLFAAYLGLRHLPPPRSGPGPSQDWSAPARTVLMFRALGDYGRLMVFPSNLHMERTVVDGRNYSDRRGWESSVASEYLSIIGLVFVALLFAGCRWRGNGRAMRIFGAIWFAVGFLPISNLVELNATCAEHWLYLPSVGLLIFLAGCLLDLPARYYTSLAAFGCLATVGLGLRSSVRSSDWISPEVFYQRTIAAGGNSMRVGGNLADLYARRGDRAQAKALLRKVLAAVPDFPSARNNLARLLYEEGKTKEADALFAQAAKNSREQKKSYPRTWIAVVNHAQLLHAAHQDQQAIDNLDQARADYPQTWEVVSLESELLRQTGRPALAFPLVANFARTHWWHYGAQLSLGRLVAEAGDAEGAVHALHNASRLDVHEVDALNLIAQVRLRQRRFNDAYRAQREAVARQPDAPSQYALLSDILEKMGETAAAQDATAEVARLEAIGRAPLALAN